MATRRPRATAGAHSETGPGHAAMRPWWSRAWVAVVGGLAVVVGGAVAAVALLGPSEEPVDAVVAATPAPVETSTPPEPAPTPPESAPAVVERTVLVSAGEAVPIFADAGDATPERTLSQWTFYGQPLTLLSSAVADVDGETWHEVVLPERPNGQTAWVREADVEITTTTTEVRVFLDERRLELWVDGELELSAETVIGTGSTPTPTGEFYVTDMLDLQANPTGIYGAYAIGLSAYSPTLTAFNGGPPQIAIHGTDATALLGARASNGCVAIDNDKVLALAAAVGRGTPVTIYDERPAELADEPAA